MQYKCFHGGHPSPTYYPVVSRSTVDMLLSFKKALTGSLIHALYTRASSPYIDPRIGGGSLLDNAAPGLGEPMNVIVSGLSSPEVLTDSGITNYAKALGFSIECLGIHLGAPQSANLGDGNGPVNQTIELRQDYGNAEIGTCLESLIGGNHFRVFRQNGPLGNTGALFLAVSKEEDVEQGHTIVPDGYNIGRDQFVADALGMRQYGGLRYWTRAENITGLLPSGSVGINHGIAIDGIVTLLTVTIVRPKPSSGFYNQPQELL